MSILESAYKSGEAAATMRIAALLSAAGAVLRVGLARLAADRRARRAARFLDQLSDRDLKDIGLTRSDLLHLARAPSRGEAGRLCPFDPKAEDQETDYAENPRRHANPVLHGFRRGRR